MSASGRLPEPARCPESEAVSQSLQKSRKGVAIWMIVGFMADFHLRSIMMSRVVSVDHASDCVDVRTLIGVDGFYRSFVANTLRA